MNPVDKILGPKCPECGSIITDVRHVISGHNEFISYNCDNCGYYKEE
jgi:hypothetical protein